MPNSPMKTSKPKTKSAFAAAPVEAPPQLQLVKPVPLVNEAAIRDWIAKDPNMLPLGGNLVCRGKERVQPNGRLDLLLENEPEAMRYTVEIQLGAIDETHIVRAIEYWDWERTRYPYYDHRAVLLGEGLGRFFNVVSWANRRMPLILIQMLGIGGQPGGIIFNKILDVVEPAEDDSAAVVDSGAGKEEWLGKVGKAPMLVVDKIHNEVARRVAPNLELKHTKFYIGQSLSGKTVNFFKLCPQKRAPLILTVRMNQSEEWTKILQDKGIYDRYNVRAGERGYHLRIPQGDEGKHLGILRGLLAAAMREAGLETEMRSGDVPEKDSDA